MNIDRKTLIDLVLNKLLEEKIIASLAPKDAGSDYDIIVKLNEICSVKIKVRGQTINSQSTNNSIDPTGNYDFLVIVVDDNGRKKYFILSKNDVNKEKGKRVKLTISNNDKLLPNINQYEDNWKIIKDFSCD